MSDFHLKAKYTESKPKPAGSFIARCVQIIDLGTQSIPTKNGGTWEAPKVILGFETAANMRNTKDGQIPYIYEKEFINDMGEGKELRTTVEEWLGKSLTEEEAQNFDLGQLLDKPCHLVVAEQQKDNGTRYTKIDKVKKLEGEALSRITRLTAFSFENFNKDVFESLPDYISKKLALAKEYDEAWDKAYAGGSTSYTDELPDINDINLDEIQTPF